MARSDPIETLPRLDLRSIAAPPWEAGDRVVPRSISAFPDDAAAVIEPVEPPVTQSAPRLRTGWRLRFERRERMRADPLTRWAGSGDTLQQAELSFPTRAAAEAYARRHGLRYRVREQPARRSRRPGWRRLPPPPLRLGSWPARPRADGPGAYPLKEVGRDDAETER